MPNVSSRQTKATFGTDGGNYQTSIPRRLSGRQPLFAMSQSPAQLWEHGHTLTEYQVWVCYKAATHQLNLYFPGRERDATCKRYLKDVLIYFGVALGRTRCGHTSSRSGHERRYHPLKWSCTNKQHYRGRHLSYIRMCGRLSSKCSQITLTSLAKPGKEYGE